MRQALALLLGTIFLAGCGKSAPAPAPAPVDTTFSIAEANSGMMTFEVVFTRHLTGNRVLKITATSNEFLGRDAYTLLTFSDSLQQADGKWVIFDCENIADKIIDANLVKEIAPLCATGHGMGKDYWEQRNYAPDEFVDTIGVHWKKVR